MTALTEEDYADLEAIEAALRLVGMTPTNAAIVAAEMWLADRGYNIKIMRDYEEGNHAASSKSQ